MNFLFNNMNFLFKLLICTIALISISYGYEYNPSYVRNERYVTSNNNENHLSKKEIRKSKNRYAKSVKSLAGYKSPKIFNVRGHMKSSKNGRVYHVRSHTRRRK